MFHLGELNPTRDIITDDLRLLVSLVFVLRNPPVGRSVTDQVGHHTGPPTPKLRCAADRGVAIWSPAWATSPRWGAGLETGGEALETGDILKRFTVFLGSKNEVPGISDFRRWSGRVWNLMWELGAQEDAGQGGKTLR